MTVFISVFKWMASTRYIEQFWPQINFKIIDTTTGSFESFLRNENFHKDNIIVTTVFMFSNANNDTLAILIIVLRGIQSACVNYVSDHFRFSM